VQIRASKNIASEHSALQIRPDAVRRTSAWQASRLATDQNGEECRSYEAEKSLCVCQLHSLLCVTIAALYAARPLAQRNARERATLAGYGVAPRFDSAAGNRV
jgi:hypothetical protein